MNIATWRDKGHYFKYREKYDIFYQVAGSGPPLLLLHGFPTASFDWVKVWPTLTSHYRVIAFDFIGFGFSAKPAQYQYSLHDQADLTEALLEHLGIESFHCLAHDYGDSVAQELLARHYEQMDQTGQPSMLSLAMLNGGIFPGTHHPRFIQKALASPIGFLLSPFLSKKKLRSNFEAIFGPDTQPSPQEIDDFWYLMEYNRGKYRAHQLIRYMHDREVHERRWFAATTRGALSQCIINGTFDPISGGHVANHYEKHVSNALVYRLENIGHYPQTEAPEKVMENYLNFRKD